MARKAIKGALAASILGQGAQGFAQGLSTRMQLEQMMAERELKKQQLQMQQDELDLKRRPKSLYDEKSQKFIGIPPEYSDAEVIRKPSAFSSGVGMSQFVGQTPDGQAVIFQPSRGGSSFTTKQLPVPGGQLQPKVAPTMPAEQAAQTANLSVIGTTIKQMNDNYDDSFIGPIASRAGKVKQYIEPLANEKAGKFYGALADIKNQLIYLRSGKQINENEYQRLRATLPEETASPTDFKAKLANFDEVYKSIISSRQAAFGQAGFRNQGGGKFKIINVEGQ